MMDLHLSQSRCAGLHAVSSAELLCMPQAVVLLSVCQGEVDEQRDHQHFLGPPSRPPSGQHAYTLLLMTQELLVSVFSSMFSLCT